MPTLRNVPVPPTGQKSAVWGPQSARRPAVIPYRNSRNPTGTPSGVRQTLWVRCVGATKVLNRLNTHFRQPWIGRKTDICGLVTVLACQIQNAVRQCQDPTGRPPGCASLVWNGGFGAPKVINPPTGRHARRKPARVNTCAGWNGRRWTRHLSVWGGLARRIALLTGRAPFYRRFGVLSVLSGQISLPPVRRLGFAQYSF